MTAITSTANRRMTKRDYFTALKTFAEVGEAGWSLASDIAVNAIAHDRLLALWPVSAVPKTRSWLAENVYEGLLQDVKVALRLDQGGEPRLASRHPSAAGPLVRLLGRPAGHGRRAGPPASRPPGARRSWESPRRWRGP